MVGLKQGVGKTISPAIFFMTGMFVSVTFATKILGSLHFERNGESMPGRS